MERERVVYIDPADVEVVYDPSLDGPHGLGAVPPGLLAVLARLSDAVLEGHRGTVLTEALIAAGYARDPATLRAVARAYPGVLDDWLASIDVERIASRAMADERPVGLFATLTSPTGLLLLGAGLALGVALAPTLRPDLP